MTGFGIGKSIVLNKITSYQVSRWSFENLFVPFGIPKMIVVDSDGFFDGIFKNNFQETLLVPVHSDARGNHKAIIN